MDGVGTPIIGRPRPLRNQDTPNPAHNTYTLKCEEPDAVIENNDELLEKYIAGEPISREKLAREEQQRVQDSSLFPVYHGSAKNGLGIQPLMDAVTGLFQPIGEQGGAARKARARGA